MSCACIGPPGDCPCIRWGRQMAREFPQWAPPVMRGCICPPTSEQTCASPLCPRKRPPSYSIPRINY